MIRQFHDSSIDPPVRGFLHIPESANGSGLVLTHGAGGSAQASLLVALAETFCAAGFTVLRCDLPYRQVRSFGPPGPGDAARDRAGLKNAVAAIRKTADANFQQNQVAPPAPRLSPSLRQGGSCEKEQDAPSDASFIGWEGRIFLAGHSYGGRQASMLCAEERDLASGLLLLSYPLHPPRRPEQQRTQHLPSLHTPALFVSGTRDPFGTVVELEHALKMIPARTKLLAVENAGHDLGFKGKGKKEELPRLIFAEFQQFLLA